MQGCEVLLTKEMTPLSLYITDVEPLPADRGLSSAGETGGNQTGNSCCHETNSPVREIRGTKSPKP